MDIAVYNSLSSCKTNISQCNTVACVCFVINSAIILPSSHKLETSVVLIPVLGSQPAGDRSHKPGGRLPLLVARPAVTSSAAEHHRPLARIKLYCLMKQVHVHKQLAQGRNRQHGDRDSNPRPVDRTLESIVLDL